MMAAHIIRPTGYLKNILGRDEKIEFVTRQHWLVLLGRIFFPLFWCAVIFFGVGATQLFGYAEPPQLFYAYGLIILPAVPLIWRYMSWHNHCFVMTSRRVIQMHGVFDKTVSDSLLEKLNDVKTEQSLLGRILGYGNIVILTASEAVVNDLKMISRPLAFKRAMLEAKEALDHPVEPA
ncbi:MAG: PH domain-containing protein [Rhizobiales bacterium]|nr:PH domain-containing protein [Hyphomicrobiales bacterium]